MNWTFHATCRSLGLKYGNLTPCGSTLWVTVKRHAIHHGCIVLCTEDTWKVTTRVHRVMEWQRTLYLLRKESLHCDQPVSQYSISLRTHHSVTSWDVIDQCWPDCGVLSSPTSYSGFYLDLVQLIAWTEDTYIGSTLRLFIVSSTLRSLFSPSDENTARNSWRRV